MKKLILPILTVLALSTYSQDKNTTTTSVNSDGIKPEAKSITAELNLTPFSGTPLSISYLRFRYFIAERIALRAGASIALKFLPLPANTSTDTYTGSISTFAFSLRPGIEKHFKGTNRLSPFIGGEADITLQTASANVTRTGGGTTTNYVLTGATNADPTTGGAPFQNRGYFRFGLNAIAGFDFYIAKHLYLGSEFGFGLYLNSNTDVVATSGTTTVTTKGGTTFEISPSYNSSIRVGFLF
ncbi:MAG: hypothetical protein SFY32_10860 [Bacteroidota bacterium]|nr:hypothetical protein [Bacteroidota bacterium]